VNAWQVFPQAANGCVCGDGITPGSQGKETNSVKISRTLSVIAALLVPLLAIGAIGTATMAAAPGPTVPYKDSYPITVAAGDYDLVYRVLDFAPGAQIPLHYHGGPTAMVVVAGELTVQHHDGSERKLNLADTDNEEAGAHHVMLNTSTAGARILVVMLLPKGAAVTTMVDTTTKMLGPTVPFKGSYPMTVAAGEYDLVNNVLDFAPGAEVPLHYHGGPAIIVDMDGDLTISSSGHEHALKPGDLDTQATGAQHQMMNMGSTNAQALFGVLLPKGAKLTTLVEPQAVAVGMPSTGSGNTTNWLVPALALSLLCLAIGSIYRSRRPTND
jgi:quercetin dioxygenase-like cupin family protein